METTEKPPRSAWGRTRTSSLFSDERGCGTDRTEDEQEDLPYDGDVGITYKYSNNAGNLNGCACTEGVSVISNFPHSEENNIKATANHETYPQPEGFCTPRDAIGTTGIPGEMLGSEASLKKDQPAGGFSKPDSKERLTCSKISDILLRHFSEGELTSTCQLIECETIPETSLTESIGDTVNRAGPSEHIEGPVAPEERATDWEKYHSEKHKEINTGDKSYSLNEIRCVSKKLISSAAQGGCRQENSQLIGENDNTHTFQNMREEKDPFKKTVSLHELKYGQAHCCLPDFSEVASEVKEPKRSESINSVPTTARAESFPLPPRKSVTANNILGNESYFNSVEIENQEEASIAELLQQLEMLTQRADTQNHPDHLRWNPKMLPQSDFPNAGIAVSSGGTGPSSEAFALRVMQSTHGLTKARLHCGAKASALPAAGPVGARSLNPPNLLPELTVGEKMSQILKDQTDELIKKVEDFSKHMTEETFLLQDYYLALNQLKSHLDTLEKNYLTAKEQHRCLQLQNYKDKSISVGEFDPERKIEGEIFRLGVFLEGIQEQTDDSKCNLSSLLTSSGSALSPSHCESSAVSSIADAPERSIETAFLHKNKEGEKTQTTDVIPQRNQFSLEECSLCLHINTNTQERKTGTHSLFIQRKTTDLSDTNLSSDSEGTSGFDSYSDSLREELVNCETESYRTFHTRLRGDRKALRCRSPRETGDQFKLRNYKDSVQSCALCRNKSSGSSAFLQKRTSTQKPQKNKQPHEVVSRVSERQNIEAARTCYSSTYDKILFSHHCLPSKKSARSKSAINIRSRNANDFHANILSSTLDHALHTANSLKKATERMVRAVSEDLAKAKRKQL